MKFRLASIALIAALVPLSFIQAPYPEELVLQHVPTVCCLAILVWATFRIRPHSVSFACVVTLFLLHMVGARWIYSFVPYDQWFQFLTGETLSEQFGWQRNHYDRLVHLASGLLGVPPTIEILQRYGRMRPIGAAIMAVAAVLAIGAIYEILEWQIAVTCSPDQAEAYNGQQGDIWDPQKDLALAGIGGGMSAALLFRWRFAPSLRELS